MIAVIAAASINVLRCCLLNLGKPSSNRSRNAASSQSCSLFQLCIFLQAAFDHRMLLRYPIVSSFNRNRRLRPLQSTSSTLTVLTCSGVVARIDWIAHHVAMLILSIDSSQCVVGLLPGLLCNPASYTTSFSV